MNDKDQSLPTISVSYKDDTIDLTTIDLSALDLSADMSGTGYTISGSNGASASNVWIGAAGSNGYVTPWTTSTSVNWQPPQTPVTMTQSGKVQLRGDGADIDINGRSMKEWMEKVEERLNILTPNPELEAEWDELRRLGERYRKLEKKCKEKAEVWKKLKEMPPPKVD